MYVCACKRRIRRTTPATAERDTRYEPRPHTKQKTRLTPCPTLPSLCTEDKRFLFLFALPVNPVARTFRIKIQGALLPLPCLCPLLHRLIDPCIAQPSIRIKELRPPYYCQIFRSHLCRCRVCFEFCPSFSLCPPTSRTTSPPASQTDALIKNRCAIVQKALNHTILSMISFQPKAVLKHSHTCE